MSKKSKFVHGIIKQAPKEPHKIRLVATMDCEDKRDKAYEQFYKNKGIYFKVRVKPGVAEQKNGDYLLRSDIVEFVEV